MYILHLCTFVKYLKTIININCYTFAFSALTLLVGGRKGIWPVKTEWWGAGVVVCLE